MDLTLIFLAMDCMKAVTMNILFCFKIRTINPQFVTVNNLFEYIFINNDHFQIILRDFEAKIFLLYREQFWNEFHIHVSYSKNLC